MRGPTLLFGLHSPVPGVAFIYVPLCKFSLFFDPRVDS